MRVGLYARVSTEIQAREGDSVQAQLDALRKYAKDHSYEIVGEFCDDGVSGTLLEERDELQNLLDSVKRGEIDLILFTRLDRWFRSIRHYLNVQDTLDRYGVPWRAVWETFETQTPQGRFMVNQTMSFAQYESETTTVRINHVFDYKKQNHEVLSGKVPYGYMIVNKHMVANPETVDRAREIFDTYIATGSICETLRRIQPYEVAKTQRSLKLMLQNRKYIGESYGIENYHEAIIDRDTFDLVQEMLSKNQRKARKFEYIFTGMTWCSDCGRKMTGTTDEYHAKKIRYKVYRCMFHYRTIPTCGNARTLNEAKLEKYLVENIKNLAFAEINEGKDKEKPDYEKQIESLERKIERLKDLYVNELITLDEYKHDVASYRADIERFRKDMRKYANDDKSALKQLVGMNLEDWYWTLTVAEKRTLWLGVIDKIWYGDDKQIRVDFLT